MTDLTPGSPEWARLMTASKVAAALGVSPWESPRSLWHKMRGDVPWGDSNEVQRRGHYLEPAILAWWRDRHPEHAEWRDHPTWNLNDWAAATPDATALFGTVGESDWERVLVEAKSAAYDDEWGIEGTDQIPAYYLAQCYFQLELSGAERCYVPILTSRLRFAEYVVEADPEIGADLVARVRAFYDTLADDTPPPLDNSVATFESLRRLHPEIDDETVECDETEARRFLTATSDLKDAEARDREARSWALDRMGRARYLTANGIRIARRQPNKSGVSLYPLPKNLPLLALGETA